MVHVSIVGAGIGGLTTAVALHDVGYKVSMFEQAAEIADEGAGIQLTPNAGRLLCHLGLRPALDADGVVSGKGTYRHYRTGAVLRSFDLSDSEAHTGFPHWRIHRADLHRALAGALAKRAPDALRLGSHVRAVEPDCNRVTVSLEGGEHLHCDLVVAADGIRSLIRTALFGADQPHFEGYVAWRGLVPAEDVPDNIRVSGASFGNGRFIVSYPIRRRELMNFVAIAQSEKWEEEGWRIPSHLSELQEAFGDFHDDVQALIRETPPDRLFKWGIFGRPRMASWVRGRVALLGDAAHPMLPYMTQGAAMSIEDALILARALKLESDPEQGLRRWETARMSRVNRVSDASAAMAELFHTDVDNYDPAKDVSGGRLPDLATYDALTAPI